MNLALKVMVLAAVGATLLMGCGAPKEEEAPASATTPGANTHKLSDLPSGVGAGAAPVGGGAAPPSSQ